MKRALLLLAVLNGATGLCAQNVPSPPLASPAEITPRVKTALGGNAALNGSVINVDSVSATRTVTLAGTVTSAAQKVIAGAIAGKHALGWKVVNLLVVGAAPPIFLTQAVSPWQSSVDVPAKYKRAVQFLQLLARSQGRGPAETFGGRKTAFPDVKHLLTYVSARGVTIVDVNENNGRPLVLSRAILGRDLKRTGSSAFDSFAFVGYTFNLDYAQDLQLSYLPTKTGVVIEMSGGHRMTWVREAGRLRLRKLEYLRVEGD